MEITLKKLYLYVVTLLGLVLMVIGGVQIVNLALKLLVFTRGDVMPRYPQPASIISDEKERQEPTEEEWRAYQAEERATRREQDAARSLAFLLIGTPIYLFHWRLAKKG